MWQRVTDSLHSYETTRRHAPQNTIILIMRMALRTKGKQSRADYKKWNLRSFGILRSV